MDFLRNFCFGNYILSVAVLSWMAAQICKTLINFAMSGSMDLERLYGAGGMPSAHSALVCSLVLATAKSEGVQSPVFALAFVFATVVMYDAMGVRHETGKQAKILNVMMKDWLNDDEEEEPGEKQLKEKVGHTPFEVLSGALLGILIAIILPVV